jgi:GntR family transcriptional regulator, transcriptional repressor for pyruvate dehydrogenase complex
MLTPIKNTKVYEQVIEQIKEMIADGTLKKGDKLPSERDLVEQLQVSRTSIREALRAMEIIGLIECRQGGGNFVRENFENSLFEPLSVMFMLEKRNPSEIIELRKVIEVETVALAAERITDDELQEIGEIIEELKVSENEEVAVKVDKRFHYAVARAAKNGLILAILNAVSSLIDDFIKDARMKILQEESNRVILSAQHEQVYLALRKHDASAAVKAMRDHLDFANEYMTRQQENQSK